MQVPKNPTRQKFSQVVYNNLIIDNKDRVGRTETPILDAIIYACSTFQIDPERVKKYLDSNLISMLERESGRLNLLVEDSSDRKVNQIFS